MNDKVYRLPKSTLGGASNETLLGRLRQFEAWSTELGIPTRGTRVQRYQRYLESFPGLGPDLDRGIFVDPPDSPMRHGLDRYLYVLREVHELTWISQSLRGADVRGVPAKLSKAIGGSDFAALDRDSASRNTQFELRIASYFARGGFSVDLETLTDVVASKGGTTYHVECKRIASPKQLERRLKEAVEQLRLRAPNDERGRKHVALVAADVTKVGFSRNGLTMAMTSEHSRAIIQEKLANISADIERAAIDFRPACALWLQIHISCLILTPPTPGTRFSNYVVRNERGGSRLRKASDQFSRTFRKINTNDPGDEPPVALRPRRRIVIPAGIQFAPDLELLSQIAGTGRRPNLPDEHIILSVLPPHGREEDWIDFSFFEFKLMFDVLSPKERREFMRSTEVGVQALLTFMLLRRYPYEGSPSWLDKSS